MSSAKHFHSVLNEWAEAFMRRSMREWLHYVRSSDLSLPQFNVLMMLHHRGDCGVSDVGAHMAITAAAASQLVEGLVQKGLMERTEDPADRRAKQLTLTPRGQQLIERGIEARNRWTDQLTRRLTAEQRDSIGAALKQLTEAVRQLEHDNA